MKIDLKENWHSRLLKSKDSKEKNKWIKRAMGSKEKSALNDNKNISNHESVCVVCFTVH